MNYSVYQLLLWVTMSMLFVQQGVSETLMEKLGYEKDDVLLIIHADDMGMCHSANQACMEALDQGIVTSASIMVPCPWFMEAAEYAKNNPEADLGIHLTLTSEWKHYRWGAIASKHEVPGLLDDEGYLFHEVRGVYGSASVEEVEKEVRAQIEFALDHSIQPTHLDSHVGTLYYNPEYLQMMIRLAEEYDIPFMFFNATEEFLEQYPVDKEPFFQLSQTLKERGWPLLDSLPEVEDVPLDQLEQAYRDLIAGLKPGVHLIILHPNKLTPESRAITGTHERRDKEYRIFTDPAMGEFIEEAGVKLIGWKELKKAWDQRSK